MNQKKTTGNNSALDESTPNKKKRDRYYFDDISGSNKRSQPKAHVILRYIHQYIDGTYEELEVLSFDKPVLNVFKHTGFVNVCLDFGRRTDADLRMCWSLLKDYANPLNSIDFTPEEIDEGYYIDPVRGKQKVYIPVLSLILSPIGREDEYELHGVNPIFSTLSPSGPDKQEPCVLQLTFSDMDFEVRDNLAPLDYSEIENEVSEEFANNGQLRY